MTITKALQNRKLLHYCGVGSIAVSPDNPRGILPDLIHFGWKWLFDSFEPMAVEGLRRWILWMPFGRDPMRKQVFRRNGVKFDAESNLRIDQFSLAKHLGYSKLCNTFATATKAFVGGGPDREVMAYLGTIVGAPEWEIKNTSAANLRERLDVELQPYFEAGVSLAFDSACVVERESWFYEYLQDLKTRRGIRCYIEAWPEHGFEHLAQENAICLTEQLKNYNALTIGSRPADINGVAGFIDPGQLTGERQVWLVGQVAERDRLAIWYREILPAMLANPWIDSVAFYVDRFMSAGGRLAQLIPNWSAQVKW